MGKLMAVDGVSNLQQFANLAASVSENSNIRASDKGLSATKHHTYASTIRASMEACMSALKAEFGDTIADAASVQLKTLTNGGVKSRKAWMVRQMVDNASVRCTPSSACAASSSPGSIPSTASRTPWASSATSTR